MMPIIAKLISVIGEVMIEMIGARIDEKKNNAHNTTMNHLLSLKRSIEAVYSYVINVFQLHHLYSTLINSSGTPARLSLSMSSCGSLFESYSGRITSFKLDEQPCVTCALTIL